MILKFSQKKSNKHLENLQFFVNSFIRPHGCWRIFEITGIKGSLILIFFQIPGREPTGFFYFDLFPNTLIPTRVSTFYPYTTTDN
jgi:hypothetical protein